MDSINIKMRDLLLSTPERQRKNNSHLSTPGLPFIETPEKDRKGSEPITYPNSPQAGFYPVVVPHRIFVGGFPQSTTEHELRSYFERFGTVREVKIIRFEESDENKRKYNYGFVTYSSEEEAKRVVEMSKAANGRAFKFQGSYLNVNEAVKKPSQKRLQFGSPVAVPQPQGGWILREQNGQLLPVYPTYAVVPGQNYGVIQPQCISMQQPMVPVMIQPPPVFQYPPALPPAPPVAAAQQPYVPSAAAQANPTSNDEYYDY